MRGEQNYYSSDINWKQGSPPLARGTEFARQEVTNQARITPACAGNSVWTILGLKPRRDHPRLRGEQVALVLQVAPQQGSPPLARGTVILQNSHAVARGITPACAGNRTARHKHTGGAWDHPRLRGEQRTALYKHIFPAGSPPLARGTVGGCAHGAVCFGITPACAGNSSGL